MNLSNKIYRYYRKINLIDCINLMMKRSVHIEDKDIPVIKDVPDQNFIGPF